MNQRKGMALTQIAKTQEDWEITDSEEKEPIQANTSAPDSLIAV